MATFPRRIWEVLQCLQSKGTMLLKIESLEGVCSKTSTHVPAWQLSVTMRSLALEFPFLLENSHILNISIGLIANSFTSQSPVPGWPCPSKQLLTLGVRGLNPLPLFYTHRVSGGASQDERINQVQFRLGSGLGLGLGLALGCDL